MKTKAEAPTKLLRTFFKDRKQPQQPAQNNQAQNQQESQKFDPIEVIKCLSEMRPISIIYGKKPSIQQQQQSRTEIIWEGDVQGLLKKHGELGYQALTQENYKDGLLNLRKADIILNAYISNEGRISQEILMFIKMNLGITFYKIGLLEEAYTCFETCILGTKGKIPVKNQNNRNNTNFNVNSNSQVGQNEYFSDYLSGIQGRMQKRKLKIQLYLQCCILLSELGKHEEGLTFGRLAAKKCISQILDSMTISYQNLMQIGRKYSKQKSRPNSNGKNQQKRKLDLYQTLERLSQDTLHDTKNILWNDFYSPKEESLQRALTSKFETQATQSSSDTIRSTVHQENMVQLQDFEKKIFDYSTKLLPILFEIYKKMEDLPKLFISQKKEKIVKNQSKMLQQIDSKLEFQFEQADLSLIFNPEDVQKSQVLKMNILGLLQLKPVTWEAIGGPIGEGTEVEDILEYISYLAVSFYCNSTETRFIDDLKNRKQFKISDMTDSENWLSRSLEISYVFLPHEMPLVGQIISVHNKFHGITKQVIPEDSPLDGNYSVIKTLKGGSKSNFFIPIIRKQTNNRAVMTNPDEDYEDEFTQSSNQKQNILNSRKSQQSGGSNRKPQRRASREKVSNTIDYAGSTIQNRNKFFTQHSSQNRTINTAGNHSQLTDQSFGSLEKVYRNGITTKAHSAERRQRNIIQSNQMNFQNEQINLQVTNNNSYNNSRLVSPKQQEIPRQVEIHNGMKPRLRLNPNFPSPHGSFQHHKNMDPLKNNFIEVDHILGEIQMEKEQKINHDTINQTQRGGKKKNLDIQINNNM